MWKRLGIDGTMFIEVEEKEEWIEGTEGTE
jgi:hypothetical protein